MISFFRNPKETRENKELAKKLISKWSRPIFNLETDFATMTREERQKRDREMAIKLKQMNESRGSAKANRALAEAESSLKALRPGDPGWVCRARVPMVDNREYVVRPEWQTTVDISRAYVGLRCARARMWCATARARARACVRGCLHAQEMHVRDGFFRIEQQLLLQRQRHLRG